MEPIESGQGQERGAILPRCDECGATTTFDSRWCSEKCYLAYKERLDGEIDRVIDAQTEAKRLQFLLECTTFLQSIKEKLGGVL